MDIRSIFSASNRRFETQRLGNKSASESLPVEVDNERPVINLEDEISNAAEEIADLISSFGRFSKVGRKNDGIENDFVSSMLTDDADEKVNQLIKQVVKLQSINNLMNYARQLFPHDSDLILALREMLLSRQLSENQKKKIKETIAEIEKFCDVNKIRSGINIGKLAKRFSSNEGEVPLSSSDLRDSYLSFLELDISAGFIYKNWIDTYGYQNRKRLLSFTLSALIADMKANEPGIHFSEFGPLSAKLTDARLLNTLDVFINKKISTFPFISLMKNKDELFGEENIIDIYLAGLIDSEDFKIKLKLLSEKFMQPLMIKHKSMVIQAMINVYNKTPRNLFVEDIYSEETVRHLTFILSKMLYKEKNAGVWTEYYK